MSVDLDHSDLDLTLICEWCGGTIEEPEQECPALDEGVCVP